MKFEKWNTHTLGALTIKITKGTTPTTLGYPFVEKGINFIKAESLTFDGTIDKSKFVFISEEANKKLKRSILEESDILFSMAGMVLGKSAVVTKEHLPANTNQALAIIRMNQNLALPKFIDYFMRQKSFFSYVNSSTGQSAQPNINLEEIGNLKIKLPDIETQTRIAAILTSLDDKIELNRQMNTTLEGIAQTLFQEMCLPKAGERMNSKKQVLFDICKLIGGGTPKTDVKEYWENGTIDWISAKDLTPNNGSFIIQTEKKITELGLKRSSAKLLPALATVISARGTVGNVCIIAKPMTISQSNYALKATLLNRDYYLFHVVLNLVNELKQRVSGTIFDTITTSTLSDLEIHVPTDDILMKFNEIVEPIFEQIKINLEETQTLTTLRDSLLPKLMRGELLI